MPSRNRLPNAAELVSRSLNWTRPLSLVRSDMVNASRYSLRCRLQAAGLMMNKSLRGGGEESSRKTFYGFQLLVIPRRPSRPRNRSGAWRWIPGSRRRGAPRNDDVRQKKEPPFPAAFEVDNREASNRVDRSHSVSKRGRLSHKRESLTDRKRAIFFRLYLPCRPLA